VLVCAASGCRAISPGAQHVSGKLVDQIYLDQDRDSPAIRIPVHLLLDAPQTGPRFV